MHNKQGDGRQGVACPAVSNKAEERQICDTDSFLFIVQKPIPTGASQGPPTKILVECTYLNMTMTQINSEQNKVYHSNL